MCIWIANKFANFTQKEMKIFQKVLRGATFLKHPVYVCQFDFLCDYCLNFEWPNDLQQAFKARKTN